MGDVDIALKSLQIVTALIVMKSADLMRRQFGEQEIGKRRRLGLRSHVGPDDAAGLARRISDVADHLAEVRIALGRCLEHLAGHVKLPAVIDAAQAALFVAAIDQRGATVRAEFVHQPDAALGIAEGDQGFAEKLDRDWRAIGLRQPLGQHRRNPVLTEQPAHRGARTGSRQKLVLFPRDAGHDCPSRRAPLD